MLEILVGTEQRALRRAILERVCAAEDGEKRVLIVPEQASHEMERALCETGGDTISLRAEVLSFSRLASRVCSLYGGVSRRTLDKGGRLLAMALALEQVSSRLKLYGASRRKPEFLLRMLRTLDELRGACVGPDALRGAAEETEGQLALKLEELALILESFETVLATMGQDPNDRLSLLADRLETHDYAAGRRFYLWGFSDFTGQELRVLAALLQRAPVTAALLGDEDAEDGPFALAVETRRRLRRLAMESGTVCRVERVPAGETDPALAHLRDRLLTGAPAVCEAPYEAVTLRRSTGVYDACMDAAGLIERLTLEEGWRCRDIAVCCTDPDGYGPVLASVFRRLSIPLYRAGSAPVERDPAAGMLLAALDAAAGGMEPEDVLRFLKSGLSPVEPRACDLLENYVKTWNIRGRRWEAPWDMHPDGYGLPLDDEARETLAALEDARSRGVAPLLRLRDGLRDAADTAAQVRALCAFLEEIDLAGSLQALCERCEQTGRLQEAQSYAQMYETILDALEQLEAVLGGTVRAPDDFAAMVSAVLSQYSVGTIPATLDSVEVGGLEDLRFGERRALVLLGAEDGMFPAGGSDNGLLSEQERQRLLALGLPLVSGERGRLDRSLTTIYQVVSSASERVYVNACTDQPSYLFRRLETMFPGASAPAEGPIPPALYYAPEALGDLLAGRGGELSALLDRVPPEVRARAGELEARAGYRLGALSPEGARSLYGEKLYLSASRIDRYAACRCSCFLRYGLRLKPQKTAEFDAPFYGTFVHAVLERTSRRVLAEGGFHKVSEERLEEIAREEMASFHDETLDRMLARSPRLDYLYHRDWDEVLEVVRELGRELRCSDFEPAGFEVEFSAADGSAMPPVEIEGDRASAVLSGFVDRVDLYTCGGVTYVRVVDYKTGRKAFDYTDILCGMGLQMLIYLFALEEHGDRAFGQRLRPAGVLYFPARRPVLTAQTRLSDDEAARKRQSEQTRKGLLCLDGPAFRAMETNEKPVYMPYRITAKGELDGDVADQEEFRLLRDHVKRVLRQMTDDMAAGEAEPNPIVRGADNTACAHCDYAEVCHRASGEIAARPMRKTDRKGFWEALAREEEEATRHG